MGMHNGSGDDLAIDHANLTDAHGERRVLHSIAHHLHRSGYAAHPQVRHAAKNVSRGTRHGDGERTAESDHEVADHIAKHGLHKVLAHHAAKHQPGSDVHKVLHAAALNVKESAMPDHRKSLSESVRAMARARVNILPDARTIEEAEVLHFHHRGAAVGTVHQWKDGRYRKTSQGWEPLPEPVTHAVAGPSKAEVPAPQAPPKHAEVPKAVVAAKHAPIAEPVPASKPAAPSKAAVPTAKVHAGTPYPAPEGVDPVRGPYSAGSMTKHAEWARAIKPGHEIEARWLGGNGMGHHVARGVVTKVNANSVRVRLAHPTGMDVYGSGLHGFMRGKEVNVPLFAGNSLAAMSRHGHNNGAYPVSDKTPDADHSTHTHGVMVTSKYGSDAGHARLRQTFASKEAAEAVAAKATAKSYHGDEKFHVEELPEPITSPDVPLADHVHIHSVMRDDGLEHERFGTEHAARVKAKEMSDYHRKSGLKFSYKRLEQPGASREGGVEHQAALARAATADAQYAANIAKKAADRAAHQAQADHAADQMRAGGLAAPSAPAVDAKAASAGPHGLDLPVLPSVSGRHRAKASADRLSYGQPVDDAKEFAIAQPADVPLHIEAKPEDVSDDLHGKIVDFAKHFQAAHVADKVASGFTHDVHKANFGVKVHYKRGNAYVDVGDSGRFMIPTVPGKGRAASIPVGTVRTIRAYGQAHPFYTAGNVVDGSAQAKQRKSYLSSVQHGYAFKE